jgi:hypothetical protein
MRRQEDDELAPRPRRRENFEEDDEDEVLRRLRLPQGNETGLSMASMITGLVALVFGLVGACVCGLFSTPITGVCGIAAVVLGVIGYSRGGQPFAITGIATGASAVVLAVACGITGGAWLGMVFLRNF